MSVLKENHRLRGHKGAEEWRRRAPSPGGVYASMEVWTTSERRLEGMGTAIFLST